MSSGGGYAAAAAVGLPGGLASAAAVALDAEAVRVAARLMGREGIRVEARGGDAAAAAARAAVENLLELLGEEAWIVLDVEVLGGSVNPVAEAAGAALRAVVELLGVEPDPGDAAEVLARATGLVAGQPMLPPAAAVYLRGPAAATEQPPAMAMLPAVPAEEAAVIIPCRGLEWPPVAVTGDRVRQLLQAAAATVALLAAGDPARAARLLAVESPWDYAAPRPLRSARAAALQEGATAAGVDPYTGALVVLGPRRAAGAAAARLAAELGCEPRIVSGRLLAPRGSEQP